MNLNLRIFLDIQTVTSIEARSYDYVMYDTISLPKWVNWIRDWKGGQKKKKKVPHEKSDCSAFIIDENEWSASQGLAKETTYKVCQNDIKMDIHVYMI